MGRISFKILEASVQKLKTNHPNSNRRGGQVKSFVKNWYDTIRLSPFSWLGSTLVKP